MRDESGVTLIEVMIAMAIMLIGILGVIAMFNTSSKNNKIAREMSEALYYANRQVEEILALPHDEFDASSPMIIAKVNPGSPDYTIQIPTPGTGPNDTLRYNISVTWSSQGKQRVVTLPFLKSETGMNKNID